MTNLSQFKSNLKTAANDRQAELFAQADALDARACKQEFMSIARARLHFDAEVLRAEANRIGDRYHTLVAA